MGPDSNTTQYIGAFLSRGGSFGNEHVFSGGTWGTFEFGTTINTLVTDIADGDFDGDGKTDIANRADNYRFGGGSAGDNPFAINLGDGAGNFTVRPHGRPGPARRGSRSEWGPAHRPHCSRCRQQQHLRAGERYARLFDDSRFHHAHRQRRPAGYRYAYVRGGERLFVNHPALLPSDRTSASANLFFVAGQHHRGGKFLHFHSHHQSARGFAGLAAPRSRLPVQPCTLWRFCLPSSDSVSGGSEVDPRYKLWLLGSFPGDGGTDLHRVRWRETAIRNRSIRQSYTVQVTAASDSLTKTMQISLTVPETGRSFSGSRMRLRNG